MIKCKVKRLRRLSKEEDMTLCIAAFSARLEDSDWLTSIHFLADHRVETHSSGSETEYKFRKVCDGWAGMLAGNVARAIELLGIYGSFLNDEITNSPQLINELREPPSQMKRRLASQYISALTGIPFDMFMDKGASILPSGLFESIWNDVARIELDCQLILVPTATRRDHIYTVDSSGEVTAHSNFCAIGSGSSSAEAWLHFREQNKFLSAERTKIHLLEAKRFSENAPGVGKKTTLATITHDNVLQQHLNESAAEKDVWRKFGPRITKNGVSGLDDHLSSGWNETGRG
jgi:hypothetical protein